MGIVCFGERFQINLFEFSNPRVNYTWFICLISALYPLVFLPLSCLGSLIFPSFVAVFYQFFLGVEFLLVSLCVKCSHLFFSEVFHHICELPKVSLCTQHFFFAQISAILGGESTG